MNYEIRSDESPVSRGLFELNKERIYYKSTISRSNEKKISKEKIKRLKFYIKKGAFQYIANRIKKSGLYQQEDYPLKEYKYTNDRIAVYMALFGDYDKIYEPLYTSNNIDYFIITDQQIPEKSVWKKIEISNETFEEIKMLSNQDRNRYFKILPHKFLQKYDYSIYLDSGYQIVTDLIPIVVDLKDDSFLGVHQLASTDYYDQVQSIWALNRSSKENIIRQIEKYKKEGMPNERSYYWNAILVRKHNDSECVKVMNDWWEEYLSAPSKRDQVSLPYILWKNDIDDKCITCLGQDIYKNPRFVYKGHKYNSYGI